MEPTLTDVMASIAKLSTETQTRIDSLASESRSRDTAQTERSVRLEAKVETSVSALTTGLATLNQEFSVIKTEFPEIRRTASDAGVQARQAMASHHDTETSNQERWRSVMEALDQQNAERDRIEHEKKEAKERESLAAKRLNDRRDFSVKMAGIGAPILIAVLSLAGAMYSSYTSQKAHDDTAARLIALQKQMESRPAPVLRWDQDNVAVPPAIGTGAVPLLPPSRVTAPASRAP